MADAVNEARELFLDAKKASVEQRRQIEEDLRFSDPSDPQQWDETLRRQRENDPGGARPCLVFDQIGQYVSNVSGQIEQRPPSLHALPVGSGADKKVAEQLDGFFRQIEHSSRATQHYARALTSAARAGVGYLIVRPTFVDRALNWQEPRIDSEGDPLRVIFDPWNRELDGQGADFGFLLTPMSPLAFAQSFGDKAEKVSFDSEDLKEIKDDRESIVIAESWRAEVEETTWYIVRLAPTPDNPEGDEVSLTEDDYALAKERGQPMEVIRTFVDRRRVIKWSRMSGCELLSKSDGDKAEETTYPADDIGIVPVYGYVAERDGRMTYCGIPRRAMNAQREYNFHMSEMHAYMASAPKAPWVGPDRAFAKHKKLWDLANVEQRAFLPYSDIDENGLPIASPQRPNIAVNLQNHMIGAERALQDIQAAIGMYQANLGAPSNETSGVAIDSRKQQGESSTAHFPSHLAAAIGQTGRLCMQMLPRLMDTKRQLRLLGLDGSTGSVTLDPMQAAAVQETPQGLSINPNVGKYDVRVVVGASFSTQRQQAQQAFTEMMRANPSMAPAIAPLWANTLDVPDAGKLAQVLAAVAPPEVKAVLQPENSKEGPTTAELTAKVQQLSQALQAAIGEAHQAQQELDQAHAEASQAKAEASQISAEKDAKEDEVAIKAFDAQTKRLQVLGTTLTPEAVQALTQQTVVQMLGQPNPTEDPAEGPEMAPESEAAQPQPAQQMEPSMEPQDAGMPEPQEPAGPAPEIQELMQGQEHIAQLLEMLIQQVQAPRKRTPVRDKKTGDILHVIDQIDHPAPQALQ